MLYKWNCKACGETNKIDLQKLVKDGHAEATCGVCGNTTTVEVHITTNLVTHEGTKCFTCPFYIEHNCVWEYGDAYGRCKLDVNYEDKHYKQVGTVCCRNAEREIALKDFIVKGRL